MIWFVVALVPWALAAGYLVCQDDRLFWSFVVSVALAVAAVLVGGFCAW